MNKKQIKINIEEIDLRIHELSVELKEITDNEEYEKVVKNLEVLSKIRAQLNESKAKNKHTAELLSGVFSIGGILLVLKHEQVEIITSKAFGMVGKLFKGV